MAYQYYKACGFVAQHSHAYRPDDEKRTRRGGESGNGFCFTGGDITFFAEIGYEFSSHGITAKHTHCEDITRRGRRAENFPERFFQNQTEVVTEIQSRKNFCEKKEREKRR